MIVYVESNFVLEIALGQEQADAANRILTMAESRNIQLVIPTFGLSEPFSRIRQRARDRQRLNYEMHPIAEDLRRGPHTRHIADELGPIAEAMLALKRIELDRLESTVGQVLKCAETIELTSSLYQEALSKQDAIDLEIEDSIIFTCVLTDLQRRATDIPKCFVSRDRKAFSDPAVARQLSEHNCGVIFQFSQAIQHIQNAHDN